jgi:drug/metabolite transporter (DMT)-like permease
MNRSRLVLVAVMAALAAAWGTIPLIVRSVPLSSQQLAALRLWFGALTVLSILAVRGDLRLRRTDPIARIAGLGVLLAIHWAAFFWAIDTTTVAVAIVVVYLGPVAIAALSPKILGEPLRAGSVVGLAVALGGVILVARPHGGATVEGVVAALIAAATFAAMVLIGKPAAQAVGGLKLAGLQMTVAAIASTPWAVSALPDIPSHWWQISVLGIGLTGVGLMVYWSLISILPVTTVAITSYIEPASAVIWAAVFLSEPGDLLSWFGVALVIGAGIATGRPERPTI